MEDIAIEPNEFNSGREVQLLFGSRQPFPKQLDVDDIPLPPGRGLAISGFRDPSGFGVSPTVAGPGDVNGDGIDDLLLGNPVFAPPTHLNPVGEIYVLFGSPSLINDVSKITPTTGFGFVGHGAFEWGDQLGYDVSRLGDFNGDGLNDLFVGPQGINGDHRAIVLYGTLSPVPGDANSDGLVDFGDFIVLASNFGKEDVSFHDGDFDGDGRVSFLDFLVLAQNFHAND